MRNLLILIFAISVLASCITTRKTPISTYSWVDVAVIEELEVFVDTTSISHKNELCYALVKTVYPTEDSRFNYTNKIKKTYNLEEAQRDKKMKQWENFSYNISLRVYDCLNKRYKILEVTDYTPDGKVIVSTKTSFAKSVWLSTGIDTMGDYVSYFVCDYGN